MVFSKIASLRQEKGIFVDFAERYDLVYFGNVEVHESDDPVLGITFSSQRDDDHYIHGSINDYDVTVLKRTTKLTAPKQNKGEYTWTILRIDLKVKHIPHIFVDAHNYDELLYKNIFAKFARLRMMNNSLVEINPSFAEFFQVYAPAEINAFIKLYLTDGVMQRMLQTFTALDVEVSGDTLYVYRNGTPSSLQQIEDMLREGLWMAEHIERAHAMRELDDNE